MVRDSQFFRSLDSALVGLIPAETVDVLAEWSSKTRRTYRSESQLGTGAGPYVDVEDRRWSGSLNCRTPASAVAFLLTPSGVYWAKVSKIAPTLSVEVSLHAHAAYSSDRVTFTAAMAGAVLPGVPIAAPANVAGICPRGPISFSTGRVVTLAQTDSIAFAAVVLPNTVLKMGRNHLWKIRDDVACSLAPDIRELLTRRRSGAFGLERVWSHR